MCKVHMIPFGAAQGDPRQEAILQDNLSPQREVSGQHVCSDTHWIIKSVCNWILLGKR